MNILREYRMHWKSFNTNLKSFLKFDLCNQLSIAVYSLYFPRYLIELGYAEDLYGSLMASASVMVAVFAIFAGIMSDRIGRRNSIMAGIGISKITYLTRAFLVFIPILYGSHIIHGAVISLYNASTMPFIFENSAPENRIHAFSVRGIMMRASSIIGNLIGGLLPLIIIQVMPGTTTITTYRIIFALSLVIALIGFRELFKIKATPGELSEPKSERKGLVASIRELPKTDLVFIAKFVLVRGTIGFGAGMFLPFMNTYFLRCFDAGPEITGVIFSVANFAVILGITLAPYMSDKIGMERAIVITRMMSFPMFLVMAFGPSIWWVAGAYLVRNTLQQMSGPLQDTFIMSGLSRKTRATANGIMSAAGNGTRSIALFVAGNVIVTLGYSYLFVIALVFYIISTAFFYKFFIYDPRKEAKAA